MPLLFYAFILVLGVLNSAFLSYYKAQVSFLQDDRMTKDKKKEDKSERGARKKKPKAPAAQRASSVTSTRSRVDKDLGSGGHGPG